VIQKHRSVRIAIQTILKKYFPYLQVAVLKHHVQPHLVVDEEFNACQFGKFGR